MSPADRTEALIDRLEAVDERPQARLLAMMEAVLTERQWRELEATIARRLQGVPAADSVSESDREGVQ